MATEAYIRVDTTAWEKAVKGLTGKEVRQSILRGFRKSALIIRRGVKKEVQLSTKPHRPGIRVKTSRGYFVPYALHRDVKISVFRTVLGANISLCNPLKRDHRAYVLRILNAGTGSRVTKKHLNRGSLRALNFFEKGVEATKGKAIADLDENIRKAVMRQVEKNK